MEPLPQRAWGANPCDGWWGYVDGSCEAPTTYELCGMFAAYAGLINTWYYCPTHARECAAQHGIPFPEAHPQTPLVVEWRAP